MGGSLLFAGGSASSSAAARGGTSRRAGGGAGKHVGRPRGRCCSCGGPRRVRSRTGAAARPSGRTAATSGPLARRGACAARAASDRHPDRSQGTRSRTRGCRRGEGGGALGAGRGFDDVGALARAARPVRTRADPRHRLPARPARRRRSRLARAGTRRRFGARSDRDAPPRTRVAAPGRAGGTSRFIVGSSRPPSSRPSTRPAQRFSSGPSTTPAGSACAPHSAPTRSCSDDPGMVRGVLATLNSL